MTFALSRSSCTPDARVWGNAVFFDTLDIPIVLAPLAGGPSTVGLAVAVSEADDLGFLASGYRTAADLREQVRSFRASSARPFGVNLFTPPPSASDRGLRAYVGFSAAS